MTVCLPQSMQALLNLAVSVVLNDQQWLVEENRFSFCLGHAVLAKPNEVQANFLALRWTQPSNRLALRHSLMRRAPTHRRRGSLAVGVTSRQNLSGGQRFLCAGFSSPNVLQQFFSRWSSCHEFQLLAQEFLHGLPLSRCTRCELIAHVDRDVTDCDLYVHE